MARVILESVTKRFGRTLAVNNVNMDVGDGEFVALLGSSGCGKTTLLRLLAGFETVDQGVVTIGDDIVSGNGCHVLPEKRHVGMVFQAYALWPHMSVRENVAFSLRVRRIPRSEQKTRVEEALESVGMSELGDRRPSDLSGGQRQRVALARCLAMEPRLVLLDEPLANLDVNLRGSMLDEFRRFHKKTKSTMIYVTHDQAEAMALADRIMVMEKGHILQAVAPEKLYNEPASEQVARFVGQGMVVPVRMESEVGEGRVLVNIFGSSAKMRCRAANGSEALACLRPEGLRLSENNGGFAARVTGYVYQGGGGTVHLHPESDPDHCLRIFHQGEGPRPGQSVKVVVEDGWIIPPA